MKDLEFDFQANWANKIISLTFIEIKWKNLKISNVFKYIFFFCVKGRFVNLMINLVLILKILDINRQNSYEFLT